MTATELTDWLKDGPLHEVTGFSAVRGSVQIFLGYTISRSGPVQLHAIEKMGDLAPRIWLNRWTTRESAVRDAEDMVGRVEQYLDQINAPSRPEENLGLDDFIEHLSLRLSNGLH